METAKSLREDYEAKLKELQNQCPHKKSTRMPYMWAPGHYGNNVKVCARCAKIT